MYSVKSFFNYKENSPGKSTLAIKIQTKTPWHVKNVMAESSFWKVGDAAQLTLILLPGIANLEVLKNRM